MLYEKFPLSEEQISEEINTFKAKDFSGWSNNKWYMFTPLTIQQVVDLLSGMRNVHDRLSENWDFKQVLASVIHISRTCGDEMIYNSLIHCLSELYLCDLGKLINILYVAQDKILEKQQINYAAQNFTEFYPILDETMKQINNTFKEEASLAITEWFYDIYGNIKSEEWGKYTLKVQGIITQIFTELGDQKIESYHFNDGLKAQIIMPLIEKIKSNTVPHETLISWQEALYKGKINIVTSFFEQIATANSEKMVNLFNDVTYKAEKLYGDFTIIGSRLVNNHYQHMLTYDQAKAIKFLSLLKDNCTINQEVINFIDKESFNWKFIQHENQLHTSYLQVLPSEIISKEVDLEGVLGRFNEDNLIG